MKKNKIDIRPTSGVYATYKRLSYQPWTAIAEFVDNSTQSYFDHREQLRATPNFGKLKISIVYEARDGGDDSLTITDNAFGMELEDFERAIQLDKVPTNTSGRNEFGMGLKTAACWFGSKWSVYSTQLASEFGYNATVDVDRLAIFKDTEVDLDIFESTPEEHYTIIKIENLNKKITGSRTIGKVKELLSSIYRQDIRNGEIAITYGDTELFYKEPTIFEEELDNGETRIWKKDIFLTIPHNGLDLFCHGFVALRIPASLHDAGFTLMRRGRVIVGGSDRNYRPKELFGDQNSFEYQRLFGEIHMDNWPVTQAKDDFDWHNSGLEESFIEALQPLIREYRQKAGTIRVRQQAETNVVMNQAVNDLERAGVITEASATPVAVPFVPTTGNEQVHQEDDANEQYATPIEEIISSNDPAIRVVGPESYIMPFNYKEKEYQFEIHFDSSNALGSWVNVTRRNSTDYYISINLKHAFFKPFNENKDFLAIMTKLVIAMVLAEIDALLVSSDGRIAASDIRRKMNSILEQVVNGGETR
ncbi:MAG: ATP-binding protein [Oscillospiraceae bacterium]|jgi:hypothetical protein|nr:ATP-binding protein [Oscillospiraceae bacterium]